MMPEGVEFMPVKAGSFWMGAVEQDHDARDEEKPGFENSLDEFYMARYLVSNAQYRAFVEAKGYLDNQYWEEAIADKRWKAGKLQVTTWRYVNEWTPEKENIDHPADYGSPFNLDNHPVVGVSWYEAMAYCRWLTEQFKTEKKMPDNVRSLLEQGWRVTLPSEAQWEKAARGMADKRIFPWGDQEDPDRVNYNGTKIGSTSALRCFPQGQSPSKCEDMAGNVWEWCRTPWQGDYKDYQNEPEQIEPNASRVLRGGACSDPANCVRCSARYNLNPNLRFNYIGFRVSLSPFL